VSTSPKRFRIAFSFAGEKRDFVEKVAAILADIFGEAQILYDEFHEAEFARHDLGMYLPKLYSEQANLIVPVLCPHYDPKRWTGWEWLHIYSLLTKADGHRVMPSRFEHATADGLAPTAGFVELDGKSPERFAKLILERLALNEGKPKDHYAETLAKKLLAKTQSPAAPVATPYAYFKALSDHFSTYENIGLPPPANAEGEKDVRIAIRELFVEPTCTPTRVSPEEFDAALGRKENPAKPLLPLLAGEERRIVLLADPGMGKSTLIQWLITTLAEEARLPETLAGLRGAIPLPFILRDLVGHLPKDAKEWNWPALLKAFTSYHPRAADRPPLVAAIMGDEAYLRSLLASDRAFFLIDGLDEIGDPAHRRALRDALWQGFDQYPKARWLVTSRWVGYEEAEVHVDYIDREVDTGQHGVFPYTEGVPHAHLLYLAPFDDLQQHAFARHWYLPRMGEVVGAEHAKRFVEAVRRHPAVRVIGRVPNLLYLLALLYRHRALLPHGRTHVYSAISEAYLGGMDTGIDAARGNIDAAKRILAHDQHKDKERLLATIARHMQERRVAQAEKKDSSGAGEILVQREELDQWLAPHFPGEGGSKALHTFIAYVATRSGLLLPRGEGQFGFAHLSFQEYYAACWLEEEFRLLLAEQDEAASGFETDHDDTTERATLTRERFATLAAQPAWREPLVFLVEKLGTNAADTRTILRWLFPQLHQPEPVAGEGKRPPELMPIEAARLLAALSLDPQVNTALKSRQAIWEKLWRAHLAQQGTWKWDLAPALLAASEFQSEVWKILIPFVRDRLDLNNCTGVSDLAPLAGLKQLQTLILDGCTGVADLAPLAGLKQLRELNLCRCPDIVDISPLRNLDKLRNLSFVACEHITDFWPIGAFGQMQELWLTDCARLADLAALAGLEQLQKLYLSGCTGVADLAPLAGLTQLQYLSLDRCTGLSAEAIAAFRKSHPKTEIFSR
jgi:internalin A